MFLFLGVKSDIVDVKVNDLNLLVKPCQKIGLRSKKFVEQLFRLLQNFFERSIIKKNNFEENFQVL